MDRGREDDEVVVARVEGEVAALTVIVVVWVEVEHGVAVAQDAVGGN